MAGSCEVWERIEKKMKLVIPQYVKNIFVACGYDNFYTIATIEETDLDYFKQEVVEGKVVKYFSGKFSDADVLAGCTYSAKDFEFSRGHQKLILAVVKYVKETMDKNGIDGFSSPKNTAKVTKKSKKGTSVASKRPKMSIEITNSSSVVTEQQLLGDITKHELELSRKAKATLESLVPLMYKKHQEENKDVPIRTEALLEQKDGVFKVIGSIYCPICSKKLMAFNVSTDDGIPTDSWNSSNYDRHVNNIHFAQEMKLKAELNEGKTSTNEGINGNPEKTSKDEALNENGDDTGSNNIDEGDGSQKSTEAVSTDEVTIKDDEPRNEVVSEIVFNAEGASNDTPGGSLSEISKESGNHDFFLKPLKEGDYIQLYIVDLETSQKETKIAKVTSMTESNVEAFFLEKSTLKNSQNCYFIPRNRDEIFLSKSGIVRILRSVSTSSGGELCFSDIVQGSDLRTKPNKHKKSGLRKPSQKENWKKEREAGWKY